MLMRFIAIPIVVLGVIGFVSDVSWWLLAAIGAVTALALIAGDILLDRRARRATPPR